MDLEAEALLDDPADPEDPVDPDPEDPEVPLAPVNSAVMGMETDPVPSVPAAERMDLHWLLAAEVELRREAEPEKSQA